MKYLPAVIEEDGLYRPTILRIQPSEYLDGSVVEQVVGVAFGIPQPDVKTALAQAKKQASQTNGEGKRKA